MKEFKVGRLSSEPEVKIVEKGDQKLSVVNVNLYVQDRAKKIEGTNYYKSVPIRLTAWNEHAEALSHFQKGELIGVVGHSACVEYTVGTDENKKTITQYGLRVESVVSGDRAMEIYKKLSSQLDEIVKENEKSVDINGIKDTIGKYTSENEVEKDLEEDLEEAFDYDINPFDDMLPDELPEDLKSFDEETEL